jgi:hypothetical protein
VSTVSRALATAAVCVAMAGVGPAGQEGLDPLDPSVVVSRVGEYVERYFDAARTVTTREVVVLQPLDGRLRAQGPGRTLVYDVRLEWVPAPGVAAPPRVHRRLVEIDGRAPGADAGAACLAPESGDPLAFLLPPARGAHVFGPVRRAGGDETLLALEYRPVEAGPPTLSWHGDCGTLDLPGRLRGRVLVEPTTFAVRRLESTLVRSVEIPVPMEQRRTGWGRSITAERLDVSIAYEPVEFEDPDERLLLPVEIERVTVVRTPDPRRLRVTQQFTDYRRFRTAIRVLPGRVP